jgi:hypothetical protein
VQKALVAAVSGGADCPLERCDITGDGQVRASDALGILRLAVGLEVEQKCPAPN